MNREEEEEEGKEEANVLAACSFAARYAALKAEVKALTAQIAKAASNDPPTQQRCLKSLGERNRKRRTLYVSCEELRFDLQSSRSRKDAMDAMDSCKDAGESEVGPGGSWRSACEALNALEADLHLEVRPVRDDLALLVEMFIRWSTFLLLFFGGFFVILWLIPLRLLHPALRKVGVPNNYLPMDWIQWAFAKGLLGCAGIQVMAVGREHLQPPQLTTPTVCMFNHASNLDGLILQSISPLTFKFIGKKSLFLIPIVGWAFHWAFGSIPIDRSNRSKAVASLKNLAKSVQKYGRSVAISPEGTRSLTGQVSEFKKGPFYLQEDIGKPITPVLVFGAYELWPSGRLFSAPGKVVVQMLPQFETKNDMTREQIRVALRRLFLLKVQEKTPVDVAMKPDTSFILWTYAWMVMTWVFFIALYFYVERMLGWIQLWCGISTSSLYQVVLCLFIGIETMMYYSC